ncbi:uncharacterized protein LOC135389171 [Ornithodoros turicata]|uniref:uncharacterized protein LOC135389171 n=1 Tax=Ornithodoros turicata TaxID=34597 RepID=UPI003138C9C2
MEKWEVNNEVIRLQGILKTCRVYLIRKIVSNVQRLRAQKGSEAQRKKNAEKANRLLEQLQHIKKVDVAALAKESLVSEASWAEVVTNPKATLERRAEARLLDHKSVRKFVEQFRKKNPSWKSWVPQIIDMWKQKGMFRAQRTKGGEEKSEDSSRRTEDICCCAHRPNSAKKSETTTKKPKVVEQSGENIVPPRKGSWKPIAKVDMEAQKSKVVLPINMNQPELDLGSRNGSVESDASVLQLPKMSDHFFHVTRSRDSRDISTIGRGGSLTLKQQRSSRVSRNSTHLSTIGREGSFTFKQQKSFRKEEDEQGDLHPSWLAKKRQNQSIAQFKGKKVIFD